MPTVDEINASIATTLPPVPKPVVAPAPVAHPYDAQYESSVNTINKGLAGLDATKSVNTQRLTEDDTTNTATAARNNERNLSALQNRLANQGIGYSGVNIQEQGKIGEDYTDLIGRLATNKKRGLEDIASDYANKQSGYQDQLSQAEVDRSGRETEAAKAAAAEEAQAAATKTAGDANRDWMADLTTKIMSSVQPQSTPTGKMSLPNTNPQQVIQQALKAAPPPMIPVAPPDMIRNMQDELKHQGFDIGPTDGLVGKRTLTAYNQWRANLGLPPVGRITMDDVQKLADTVAVQPGMAGMNMGGIAGSRGGQQA